MGVILFYILGVIINKFKASRQARSVEPFDKEYEFGDVTNQFHDTESYLKADNPFSDFYETSNKSFVSHQHRKNTSSVDFVSQYRRSMDHLSGFNNVPTNLGDTPSHKPNKSIGSVLQLNLNEASVLSPNLNTTHTAEQISNLHGTLQSPIVYTKVNPSNIDPFSQDHGIKESADVTSSIYSIAEPSKAATNSALNLSKNHFHKKTISSHALDEFISTGELPVLNQNPRTLEDIDFNETLDSVHSIPHTPSPSRSQSPVRSRADFQSQSQNVENHSMFENSNVLYNIPSTDSPIRRSAVRSSSPVRSPTRMPMQSSPTRSSIRSPARSPKRNSNQPNF